MLQDRAGNHLRRVGPLRGLARSFRLEAFYGVEGADKGGTFNAGTDGAPVSAMERAAARREHARDRPGIIDSNTPVNDQMRGEVLTTSATGSWFQPRAARLRQLRGRLESAGRGREHELLEVPRMLTYRPSISSIDRSQLDPAEAEIKTVELHFQVDRDGRIEEMSSPTKDIPEKVVKNSMSSMKRSRFAPRIENGLAVPTDNAVFIERVLIKCVAGTPFRFGGGGEEAGGSKPAAPRAPAEPSPPPAAR